MDMPTLANLVLPISILYAGLLGLVMVGTLGVVATASIWLLLKHFA